MPRILALDGVSEEGITILRQAGFEVDVKPAQKPAELAAIIADYDGLIVRSGTKVTAEAIEKATKLKVVGRAGAGTDNVDKEASTKRGIVVMNVPGGNTISTCEHTFALMLSLCRNVPAAHQSMMEGRWDRKKFSGAELFGKTLGIVGAGRIGGAVAKRAQAFEMKVLVFDPILTKLKAEALGVELVELDELYERSDFITIHAPKSDKTNNLIRKEQLAKMKPTCRIVNCARGGIINEQDLADALREKRIAGAALDVYTSEPIENNPFLGLDNIVTTPHLAASTDEAQLTVSVDIAHQIVDYLTTGAVVNAVNVPSMDAETAKQLKPMLELAERLGKFVSQYVDGRPNSLQIAYDGDLIVTDTYPITAAILTGFLAPLVETVNAVSAPHLLKEYGIEFSETRSAAHPNYAFQVRVKAVTDVETHEIAGTLFNNKEPRICGIDGTRVDVELVSGMLVCINEDKPGALGRIALAIGEAGVNIANLSLGRHAAGKHATTVINIDGTMDPSVLDMLRKNPDVVEARLVEV
ncbi:MAG TPA: phosphoglycerate dehydrogenase [Candidatus Hydrogenedentes bacterium]|nr:phosphoglycerate dehydrogenase [Candidatus Hydrogenedentota bacterium]HRK36588.1 phosphoglycerate dehydrogenase [Candidatus Hydrogenedentota bacterium]